MRRWTRKTLRARKRRALAQRLAREQADLAQMERELTELTGGEQ